MGIKKAYDLLGKISEEGQSAGESLANIGVLRQSLDTNPTGMMTAIRGVAASWGLPAGRGASDLQVVESMLSRLTPQQRVPGSGATSDFEMKTFRKALPSLINTPGGNKMILDAMESAGTGPHGARQHRQSIL